jgi:hypothetical protein
VAVRARSGVWSKCGLEASGAEVRAEMRRRRTPQWS